ncbi:hypothetical protein LLG95_02920 [bacterium]|nr:hypothetical protein [bacterium]
MRTIMCAIMLGAVLTGCMSLGSKTDLAQVARESGLTNVTTGDGTFENYTATGRYDQTEVGIAVGIPLICKIMELLPMYSNEALLGDAGKAAKADGATAMINVMPHSEIYTGLPFVFIGIYVDKAAGTGIKVR